jgi:cytochrome c-type biogenesis protein
VRTFVIGHALSFVAGFTLVFVVLFGIPTTVLGSFLYAQRGLLTGLGGLLIIVLGLHMAGFFRRLAGLAAHGGRPTQWLADGLSAANRSLDALILPERRLQARPTGSPGYLRSGIVGVTFAAGWTPCIGPLLGLVLTLATVNPGRALPLLLAYSTGLAVPFLASAALLGTAGGFLRRINRHLHVIELVSGGLLVLVGILLVQGTFSSLNAWFSVTPAWLADLETSLADDATVLTVPAAALAGLLSFLSPCVLPLVPIYLSYLSGTVVGTPAPGLVADASTAGPD